jgi:hypothetical protein
MVRQPGLTLLDLIPSQILMGLVVRRAARPDSKPRHIAYMIMLRRPRQPVQLHVLNHPLAQTRGRGSIDNGSTPHSRNRRIDL